MKEALADLKRSYDLTLEALGGSLDLKDAKTQSHTRRITAYAVAIARKMRFPGDEVSTIARGAFLHDMGLMATLDDILHKPGKLTDEEMAIMREHASATRS